MSNSDEDQRKIDKLTRMLCEACKSLEAMPGGPELIRDTPEVGWWWGEYKEQDRIREESEARARAEARFKREAVAKLTPAEADALGLRQYLEDDDE